MERIAELINDFEYQFFDFLKFEGQRTKKFNQKKLIEKDVTNIETGIRFIRIAAKNLTNDEIRYKQRKYLQMICRFYLD